MSKTARCGAAVQGRCWAAMAPAPRQTATVRFSASVNSRGLRVLAPDQLLLGVGTVVLQPRRPDPAAHNLQVWVHKRA